MQHRSLQWTLYFLGSTEYNHPKFSNEEITQTINSSVLACTCLMCNSNSLSYFHLSKQQHCQDLLYNTASSLHLQRHSNKLKNLADKMDAADQSAIHVTVTFELRIPERKTWFRYITNAYKAIICTCNHHHQYKYFAIDHHQQNLHQHMFLDTESFARPDPNQ